MVAPLYNVDPVGQHTYGLAHPFPVAHAGTTPQHGTVTTGSTTTTINPNGKTGTSNSVGLRIRFLDGPAAGQTAIVAQDNATNFVLATALTAAPASGNSFVLEFATPCNAIYVGPSTTVSVDVDTTLAVVGGTGTTQMSFATGAAQSLWLPIKARRMFATTGLTAVAFW
jgi:hypothetical protein